MKPTGLTTVCKNHVRRGQECRSFLKSEYFRFRLSEQRTRPGVDQERTVRPLMSLLAEEEE